ASAQGVAMETMAREARVEAFLVDHAERLAESVHHRGRRRVVVEARGAPVVRELTEIEVVAARLARARATDGLGARVVGHGRHARRTAETLLAARRRDVERPPIDRDLGAA